jgi:hypothetical protein
MLTVPDGMERTAKEYPALRAASSFQLTRMVPTASAVSIQDDWLGLFGVALRHALRLEACCEGPLLLGGSVVTPLRGKNVVGS